VIVTVSCLGNHGRFGNQLFQYAFARAYAESIGAKLQTPDWNGRYIFKDINEEIMTEPAGPSTEFPNGKGDIDLVGYFQQSQHLKLLSRKKLKQWFTFKNDIDVPSYDLVFHKRRGDYLSFPHVFGVVSDQSYNKAALEYGFDPSTAFILDDSRDLAYWLNDFFIMMRCNNLFRSNSTFAWWAATLGNCAVYSPVVEDKKGNIDVDFARGNEEPLGDFTGRMKIK
jgi:hypothetical protein